MSARNPYAPPPRRAVSQGQEYGGAHQMNSGIPLQRMASASPTQVGPGGIAQFATPLVDISLPAHMPQNVTYGGQAENYGAPSIQMVGNEEFPMQIHPAQIAVSRYAQPGQFQGISSGAVQLSSYGPAVSHTGIFPQGPFIASPAPAFNTASFQTLTPTPAFYASIPVAQTAVYSTAALPADSQSQPMMGYVFSSSVVAKGAPVQSFPPKGKKVLPIVNPETSDVTNIEALKNSNSFAADFRRGHGIRTDPHAVLQDTSEPTNAREKFVRDVAKRLLVSEANADTSPTTAVETAQPVENGHVEPTSEPQMLVPPSASSSTPSAEMVSPVVNDQSSRLEQASDATIDKLSCSAEKLAKETALIVREKREIAVKESNGELIAVSTSCLELTAPIVPPSALTPPAEPIKTDFDKHITTDEPQEVDEITDEVVVSEGLQQCADIVVGGETSSDATLGGPHAEEDVSAKDISAEDVQVEDVLSDGVPAEDVLAKDVPAKKEDVSTKLFDAEGSKTVVVETTSVKTKADAGLEKSKKESDALLDADSAKKKLLSELENQMVELQRERDRAGKKGYDREFLWTMRKILFTKQTSPPPVVAELRRLGIEKNDEDIGAEIFSKAEEPYRGGERSTRCYASGKNEFAPTWLSDRPREKIPKYAGRLSDRGSRATFTQPRLDHGKRVTVISRASIERPVQEKLHKSENAWRPDLKKVEEGRPLNADDEKEREAAYFKKVCKDVRGLLNKITPSTFASLSEDFLAYKVYEHREQLTEVINIIFEKAVEEPKFCSLYCDLCKKQVDEEVRVCGKSAFRDGILNRCQKTFENKRADDISKKNAEAEGEKNKKRQEDLKREVKEMDRKERQRMFGNIGFVGHLYLHELIVPRVILWCLVQLFKNHSEAPGGDVESLECGVRLLETVGKSMEQQEESQPAESSSSKVGEGERMPRKVRAFFDHLESIKGSMPSRLRFLVINLLELRGNHWVPRKSAESGPKTIKEVHEQKRDEDILNEIQREEYEKKHRYEGRLSSERMPMKPSITLLRKDHGAQQDGRSYGKGAPPSSRYQMGLAAGAAAAAAAATSGALVSRNLGRLRDVDDNKQQLGSSRPSFMGGSRGGGQSDRGPSYRSVSGPRSSGSASRLTDSHTFSREQLEQSSQQRSGMDLHEGQRSSVQDCRQGGQENGNASSSNC